MKKVFCCSISFVLAIGLISSSLSLAAEEVFPSRPINVINPIPAGGPTDLSLRLLADKAGKLFGQPVIVTNKIGGSFIIGTTELQMAKPDGYTIGLLANSAIFVIPHLEKTPYDVQKDFKPIIQYAEMVWKVFVRADAPYKTWKDLVEASKTKKLRIGHSGPKSLQAVVVNLMAKKEGISFINIPYKGAPEYETALIGGHIDLGAGDFNHSLEVGGKIRPVLIMADKRSPMYPNIQCMKEVGFDYPVPVCLPIAAPKDTPEPIMKRLEDVFTKAAKDPEYIKAVRGMQLMPSYRSSTEIAKYIRDTYDRVGEMFREAETKN